MLRLFRHLKAKKAPAEALPASLEAAIKGLSVFHREPIDGQPRVMVAFAGESVSSWYHTPDETRTRLAAAWPGLTDAQLDRACRAVNGVIRAHDGKVASTHGRSGWAAWKPARPAIFSE